MITPEVDLEEYSIEVHDAYIKLIDKRIVSTTISLNDMNRMMDDVESFRTSDKILLLVVTGKYSNLSNKARERITNLAKSDTFKIAIIIHSLAQRLTGNFVINLLNNITILQLFTNEEDALKWLLEK